MHSTWLQTHLAAAHRVERRMAPLSHDLAGVVLPRDTFGSHLNNKKETVDKEWEMKNFPKAGEVLAEILSKTVIDNYPTVAEYINPSDEVFITAKDQEWMAKHVRESQYLLQTVKCSNTSRCGTRKSSLFLFLPDGFLPPPLPVTQGRDGIKYGEAEETSKFLPLFTNLVINKSILPSRAVAYAKYPKGVPYDFACPKLQNELPKRICPKCGCYFATIKSKTHHISDCHRNQQVCLEMKYNYSVYF